METPGNGLDHAIQALTDFVARATELNGEHSVPISELFPVVVSRTKFPSWERA